MKQGYRSQDGCHSCRHCKRVSRQDEDTVYYCCIDGAEVPRDSLDIAKERGSALTLEIIKEAYRALEAFERGRCVAAYGICDHFNKKCQGS